MKLRIRRGRGAKWIRERGRKSLTLLPNLFTLLNLTFGVFALILALNGDLVRAAWLIVGALVADGLDGRVARWVRVDGEFGKQLDSLADVVSFGTAPGVIMYQASLHILGPYGWGIAALFPVCGALRLARFNIVKTHGYFIGLPITAAGGIVASLVLYSRGTIEPWIVSATMLGLAYLMVSTIPYPDFKKPARGQLRPLEWLVPVGLVVWLLSHDVRTLIFLPLVLYAFLGPWLFALRQWSQKVAPRLKSWALRQR